MSNIIAPRTKGYWEYAEYSEYGYVEGSAFSSESYGTTHWVEEEEYVPCEYCDMLWQDFASDALPCIEWHDMDVLFGMHLLDVCERG